MKKITCHVEEHEKENNNIKHPKLELDYVCFQYIVLLCHKMRHQAAVSQSVWYLWVIWAVWEAFCCWVSQLPGWAPWAEQSGLDAAAAAWLTEAVDLRHRLLRHSLFGASAGLSSTPHCSGCWMKWCGPEPHSDLLIREGRGISSVHRRTCNERGEWSVYLPFFCRDGASFFSVTWTPALTIAWTWTVMTAVCKWTSNATTVHILGCEQI